MHLSRDTESIVERISGILASKTISSGLSIGTGIDSILSSITAAGELRADEAGDDVDVVRGAVGEVVLVDGSERIGVATVSLGGELDGRVGAGAEIEGGAALIGGRGGVASILFEIVSILIPHG